MPEYRGHGYVHDLLVLDTNGPVEGAELVSHVAALLGRDPAPPRG